MLLDFLTPHMNVDADQTFSVYPGRTNNPGDIIKGRCSLADDQGRLEYANSLLGTSVHSTTTGQSHGDSVVPGLMLDGGLHQ